MPDGPGIVSACLGGLALSHKCASAKKLVLQIFLLLSASDKSKHEAGGGRYPLCHGWHPGSVTFAILVEDRVSASGSSRQRMPGKTVQFHILRGAQLDSPIVPTVAYRLFLTGCQEMPFNQKNAVGKPLFGADDRNVIIVTTCHCADEISPCLSHS